jgi:hypothetical protein
MVNEGNVVVVLGKIDNRIRENVTELVIGTLWYEHQDLAVVILPDGLLWRGSKREIAPVEEQLVPAAD